MDANGWISVNERLPELYHDQKSTDGFSDILLLRCKNPHNNYRYPSLGYMYKPEGFTDNQWMVIGNKNPDTIVTHWQPLPPAPEGER